MIQVALNPGTGPIKDAAEAHAETNMWYLLTDCAAKNLKFVRVPEHDNAEGRYHYLVYRGTRCHLVEMPGLPLGQVRWMKEGKQNPWHFTRLYVNGNSWLWKFALSHFTEEAFSEPTE
jgi:hypothetical protein